MGVDCVWFCLQPNDLSPKVEGRTIYYHIAEDNGEVLDEGVQGYSLIFKGNGVEELTRKFEEETGLEGIIVCNQLLRSWFLSFFFVELKM